MKTDIIMELIEVIQVYFTTIDENQTQCDFNNGNTVNGTRETF